jgi:hypothetical protein
MHLCLHGVDTIRMGPNRVGCMDTLLNGYSIADADEAGRPKENTRVRPCVATAESDASRCPLWS